MHPVLALVEDLRVLRLEDLVRHLEGAGVLRDLGIEVVERRQAVQEHQLAVDVARGAHEVHVDLIGAQHLDALGGLSLLAHRHPDIGVEHVRTLHALDGVVEHTDVDAVALRDLLGLGEDLLVRPEFLRRAADIADTCLGAAHHERIRDIVAAITNIGNRAVLQRAEGLLDRQEVREDLRGVIVVRETVPDRHAGVLRELLARLLGESAKENAVVDAAEDAGRVLDALLLAEMDVGARQVFGAAALVTRRYNRRITRTSR